MISMVSWYSPCGNKTNKINRNHQFLAATSTLYSADKVRQERITMQWCARAMVAFSSLSNHVGSPKMATAGSIYATETGNYYKWG